MFSILIKKSINLIKNHNSKINKYPYYINYICSSFMICLGESKNKNKEEDVIESFNDVMSSKEIIDYWSEISYYKVVEIREQFINLNTYESFFFSFIETIKIKGIDENLNFFSSLL